jgi:hypothetical protein
VTEISRKQTQVQTTPTLRMMAGVSFALGIVGVLFWIPVLFSPEADLPVHGSIGFIQFVANVAAQQYTPNMRSVVPILGILVTLASAVQVPASIGAFMGKEWWLGVLRVVAYAKVVLFITSGLLLGLAVFSSVTPQEQRWTLALSGWLILLVMTGAYYWMIGVINSSLNGGHREPEHYSEDDDEDEEDDDEDER